MSSLKLNRIGLTATAIVLLGIASVQGCSSSDDQAAPTAGTGGMSSGSAGKGGTTGAGTAGKGGTTGTGTAGTMSQGASAGESPTGEGGAAGATPGGMCEPAEDHGEAAYLAAHGGKLPTL